MNEVDRIILNIINESSLSRFVRQGAAHDSGVITAFRTTYATIKKSGKKNNISPENRARNVRLKKALLDLGYSVTNINGYYAEVGNRPGIEESFFVVDLNDTGELLDDLMRLGKEFEQQTILYADAGERPRLYRLYPHRRMVSKPAYRANYGQKEMGDNYSKYHGRNFAHLIDDPDFWEDE